MQILVVVASIQMGALKAEVEKGSARSVLHRRLVDPKGYPRRGSDGLVHGGPGRQRPGAPTGHADVRKGIRPRLLNQDVGAGCGSACGFGRVRAGPESWQHKQTRGHRQGSWEELSFLLNGCGVSARNT